MFHDCYRNGAAPLSNTLIPSSASSRLPRQSRQPRQPQHAVQQAWSSPRRSSTSTSTSTAVATTAVATENEDSRLSSSRTRRLSPLPASHKRPLSENTLCSLSPRPPPPTRGLPKHPARKQAPVPEFAKAFLRAWYCKNHKDPSLSDADLKALAHLTELSEERIRGWVNIARAREATTEYAKRMLDDRTASAAPAAPAAPAASTISTPFLPSEAYKSYFALPLGATPETGYFTPPTPSSQPLGGHNTTQPYEASPPITTAGTMGQQHVAGLQSPFFPIGVSQAEMQRNSSLSESSTGGSMVFDLPEDASSKHTSTTSFYSDASGLAFMADAATPMSCMMQPLPSSSSTSSAGAFLTANNDMLLQHHQQQQQLELSSSSSSSTTTATAFLTTGNNSNNNNNMHQETHQRPHSTATFINKPDWKEPQQPYHNPLSTPTPSAHTSPLPDRPYHCTYGCRSTSLNKSDWKRHEETHEPQKEYICLLTSTGFTLSASSPQTLHCQFCPTTYPPSSQPLMETHLETHHSVSRCLSVPVCHRTAFKRPDHLAQHLKTHNLSPGTGGWRSWCRETHPRKSAWGCGFCGAVLASWGERIEHVGAHFKRGAPGAWDASLVIRGLLRQPAARDAWAALLREEDVAEDALAWEPGDAARGLQGLLENGAARDPDVLALEARKLAVRRQAFPAGAAAAAASPQGIMRTPSLRFIDNFGFSDEPVTPATTSYTDHSIHDLEDVITYYGYEDLGSTATTTPSILQSSSASASLLEFNGSAVGAGEEMMGVIGRRYEDGADVMLVSAVGGEDMVMVASSLSPSLSLCAAVESYSGSRKGSIG